MTRCFYSSFRMSFKTSKFVPAFSYAVGQSENIPWQSFDVRTEMSRSAQTFVMHEVKICVHLCAFNKRIFTGNKYNRWRYSATSRYKKDGCQEVMSGEEVTFFTNFCQCCCGIFKRWKKRRDTTENGSTRKIEF